MNLYKLCNLFINLDAAVLLSEKPHVWLKKSLVRASRGFKNKWEFLGTFCHVDGNLHADLNPF